MRSGLYRRVAGSGLLNEALTEELTAINQYFIHSEIFENDGYDMAHHRLKQLSITEMKHAERLIERILFLQGRPNMSRLGEIRVSDKPEEMLAADLGLEHQAVAMYNRGIALCAEVGDFGTRDLLQEILADEEEHVDFLETQQSLIAQLGLPMYLSRQVRSKE
jgi:bacterioferritin